MCLNVRTKRKNICLSEGIDLKYGARHLKRAIERFLVYPLSNLVATQQVETGDMVTVDFDEEEKKLIFSKQAGKMIVSEYDENDFEDEPEANPMPSECRCRKRWSELKQINQLDKLKIRFSIKEGNLK